jgi:hypothetical protein
VTIHAFGEDGAANGFVYGNMVTGNRIGIEARAGADEGGVFSPNVGTGIAFNKIAENTLGVRIWAFPPEPPADPPDGTRVKFNWFRCNATDIDDRGTNTVIKYNSTGC